MRGVLLVLLACLSVSSAQPQRGETRIAMVNSRALLEAHPNGKAVGTLRDAAVAELKGLRDEAAPLEERARAGTLTAEERTRLTDLSDRYNALAQSYQRRIDALVAPITRDVDAAVTQVAQEQGVAIVMDSVAAGSQGTGLVIYVDLTQVDLTETVAAKLRGR